MKWLNLIDDNGYTRDSLRKLVDTHGTDAWGDVFGDVISEAYCDVIGDLDLDNATSKMLAEKFQALGADGQVLQKCITFYLAALRNAGLKVSPHLTEKPPRQRGEKRGRSMRRAGNGQGGSGDDSQATRTESSTPQGMVRFSFPIPDKSAATIILPGDLSADDWAMVSSMVTAYISRREKK
jgi:hypothetical protein